MYKLKKYNTYILYEEVETEQVGQTDQTTQPVQTDSDIDNLMKKLIDLTNEIQKETNEIITNYFKKNTKDGVDIKPGEEYFTYGEYNVTGYTKDGKDKKMVFVVKLGELTENGYPFSVVKSLSDPELQNINNNEIQILDDKGNASKMEDKGFIDGRYLVSSQDKINLIQPKKEETDGKKVVDTKEKPSVGKPSVEKPSVEELQISDEETLKSQVDKLKEVIEKLNDETKLSSYLKKTIETKRRIDSQISKLEKLPQNKTVKKSKRILEIDSSLMGELKSLITKKLT